MSQYQLYIDSVRHYIHENYSGKLADDILTQKFWEMYLSNEYGLNPKFFKPTGTFTIDNKEYIFTTNLPQKITHVLQKINPVLYSQLQEEVFNRTKRLAFISLLQKKKKIEVFPQTIKVLKNGLDIDSTNEVIATEFDTETTFTIISEKIPGQNVFEFFFSNPNMVPAEIELVPQLFEKMQAMPLPEFLRYNMDYIEEMVTGAQHGLDYFTKHLNLVSSQSLQNRVTSISASDFTTDISSVFFPDATPHNFVLQRGNVKLVDLESLGYLYKSFALGYQAVYFLIHLPFNNISHFRQLFLNSMRLLASNTELFEKALLITFLTHGAKVVEFSFSRQTELLHKNLVEYNTDVAKKLFQGESTRSALIDF